MCSTSSASGTGCGRTRRSCCARTSTSIRSICAPIAISPTTRTNPAASVAPLARALKATLDSVASRQPRLSGAAQSEGARPDGAAGRAERLSGNRRGSFHRRPARRSAPARARGLQLRMGERRPAARGTRAVRAQVESGCPRIVRDAARAAARRRGSRPAAGDDLPAPRRLHAVEPGDPARDRVAAGRPRVSEPRRWRSMEEWSTARWQASVCRPIGRGGAHDGAACPGARRGAQVVSRRLLPGLESPAGGTCRARTRCAMRNELARMLMPRRGPSGSTATTTRHARSSPATPSSRSSRARCSSRSSRIARRCERQPVPDVEAMARMELLEADYRVPDVTASQGGGPALSRRARRSADLAA